MTADAGEILLVEDNPRDVELTLYALKKHKLATRIEVVGDGVEAMDYIFSTGRFSTRGGPGALKMVLLDLKLPRVDGIEVLRRIKSDPRTKSIPVVVLTSSKEEPDIEESYRLGANSYVVKPVDFDAFAHTVQRIGIYWLQLNQRASADFQDGASVGHDG